MMQDDLDQKDDEIDYNTARNNAAKSEENPTQEESKIVISKKVPCGDCGKLVSEKTLKYTHKNLCKSKTKVTTNPSETITLPPPPPITLQKPKHRYSHISFFK
jgi:hypothetical protein